MTAVNLATADLFHAEIARLQAEIERLRLALRRLADQDATLSACDGTVTVTMDATLTDAEREAVRFCGELARLGERPDLAATLRGLLERTALIRLGTESSKRLPPCDRRRASLRVAPAPSQ